MAQRFSWRSELAQLLDAAPLQPMRQDSWYFAVSPEGGADHLTGLRFGEGGKTPSRGQIENLPPTEAASECSRSAGTNQSLRAKLPRPTLGTVSNRCGPEFCPPTRAGIPYAARMIGMRRWLER